MRNYKQIDGKLITDKPSKLDDFSNYTSAYLINTYASEGEYLEFLTSLSKDDLQKHSVFQYVTPTDSQERLIKLLIAEYKKIKGRINKQGK